MTEAETIFAVVLGVFILGLMAMALSPVVLAVPMPKKSLMDRVNEGLPAKYKIGADMAIPGSDQSVRIWIKGVNERGVVYYTEMPNGGRWEVDQEAFVKNWDPKKTIQIFPVVKK
jgi:hypothetical protein